MSARESERAPYVVDASCLQERIYALSDNGICGANVPLAWRLRGPIEREQVEASLRTLSRRHESLRVGLRELNGSLVQVVEPSARIVPRARTLGGKDSRGLARVAQRQAEAPFDLRLPPLARALLIELGPRERVLTLTVSHAICDDWSARILLDELAELLRGRPLPAVAQLEAADVAAWERTHRDPAREQAAAAALSRSRPLLDTPPGSRAGERRFEAHFEATSATVRRRLEARAREAGATLPVVVLAAFARTLCAWAGRADVTIGQFLANREWEQTHATVGCLVTILGVNIDLGRSPGPREAIERTRVASVVTLGRPYPLGSVTRGAGTVPAPAGPLHYDVIFNFVRTRRYTGARGSASDRLEVTPWLLPGARRELARDSLWFGGELGLGAYVAASGGLHGWFGWNAGAASEVEVSALRQALQVELRRFALV